jgi:hypothetical protein
LETCPSGSEGAGQKPSVAKRHGAALPPYATLLLNAGAPVTTVQAVLGHEYIDTTIGYTRLYNTTLAADFYQAISRVEEHATLPDDRLRPLTGPQLLALVDALATGPLNEAQRGKFKLLGASVASLPG